MINKIVNSSLILLVILVGAFFFRLYNFNSPVADWHSWRQADTSAVSRNFVTEGFDLLHPTFDDISNVPSGLDNPNGYRFVEFPLYNAITAGLFMLFDYFTIEQWGRLVTITSSLLGIVFLYFIVKKFADANAAFFTAFFAAFLPFNIYYGRTILADTSMIMFVLGAIYFFGRWIESSSKQIKVQGYFLYALALLFAIVALLLKPFAAFFLLPVVVIAYHYKGFGMFKRWQLWLFAVTAIIPLILWRMWMTQFPEGIPVSDWLFNGGGIRFKGAYFYWLFAERVGKLILGYWGIALFILGVLWASQLELTTKLLRSKRAVLFSFLAASLIYLIVIARGNVQHDYYQILIIPSIAMFLGLGARSLIDNTFFKSATIFRFGVLIACTGFCLFFSWYYVREFYRTNDAIVVAGKAVDIYTPKDAKIIALRDGDTSFLYQTKRKGWASFEKPLDVMIGELGADYLVIANPTNQDLGFATQYHIVAKDPLYVIFDLHKKP